MFDALAKIESVYDYTLVPCRPYDAAAPPVTCRALIVPPETIAAQQAHLKARALPHQELPSER